MTVQKFLLLIAFFSSSMTIFGQECQFKIWEMSSQLDYEIDTIDSEYFDKIDLLIPDQIYENSKQISENSLIEAYPNIFKKENMCYSFRTVNNNYLKACQTDTTKDIKERLNYTIKGQYCNFALIYVTGYENWGYLSVDLSDGIAFYTLGEPKTLNCKHAFSYSNYYLEEEISITDLSTKKQLVIGIDGWRTIECKQTEMDFYFKLKSMNTCTENMKFIKIKIK